MMKTKNKYLVIQNKNDKKKVLRRSRCVQTKHMPEKDI